MASAVDFVLLSLASFLGNMGVAVTGFGMAIVYIFVLQIAVLAGYDSSFKYAVFIQAIALFSAQPLLLYKAEIRKHASRRMLLYFIPITIISTPLGQITGDRVSTSLVEVIAGFLVTFVAVFEMYQKRELFAKWFCKSRRNTDTENGKVVDGTKSDAMSEAITNIQANEDTESPQSESSSQPPNAVARFSECYQVQKTLGEGGFSTVKQAIKNSTSDVYAVKIVIKSKLFEAEEKMLQDEITLLQELSHPNIVRLVETIEEPEHYYLVMENMRGGDLLTCLSGVTFFEERRGRRICKSVLGAVAYMHDKKIAHRDLKPENLLLDTDQEDAAVKIADFGFAKKEKEANSFTTMCGTPAYVAPEVLAGKSYGLEADMWSFGIITYILLAGYQPFRGEGDALKQSISAGNVEFDKKFWGNVSEEAKAFITRLLVVDPSKRLHATNALKDPWFESQDLTKAAPCIQEPPVFFMIGSQRSGSNWLRTMLDEREDLAGPHPPHVMRDFMPIIDKFGDLKDDENFRVLVDHVCTLVERNQVPWTDRHGIEIKFNRYAIHSSAMQSCNRLRENRASNGDLRDLESGLYCLSVLDAIMNFYMTANGKKMWMCKSMGMSKFHDLLLEFYGERRLRYIYLVRDPRDVAMSFMKTPVGDCHYFAIVSKWTKLQGHALRILDECPDIVHKVHYESILKDKESVVKGVYGFIGERRFGGVKRQASVLFMNPTEDLINGAKQGREANKAHRLSYQFKNLGRGESFAVDQLAKWKHPETGLKNDEIQLVESVAHEMMKKLGYKTHLVGVSSQPTIFNTEDLERFDELNRSGIEEMNANLEKENPGDFKRRSFQAATLSFPPMLLENWEDSAISTNFENMHKSSMDLLGAALLSEEDLEARCKVSPEQAIHLKEGRSIRFASATQRGYYPQEKDKPNQDASKIETNILGDGSMHWFAVYDGHGPDGHKCAEFAAEEIADLFVADFASAHDCHVAFEKAHLTTHRNVLAKSDIETCQSGTTATTLIVNNNKLFIGNVGDSTCILGSATKQGYYAAELLCTEHTPFRADERERIKRAGGVVMSVDQRDGLVPMNEDWDVNEAPPRIWSTDNDKFPGCGFTRSIGDAIAHTLGVTARPEVFQRSIESNDRVLIAASDGISQYMDPETCVELVSRYKDPALAARALVRESSKRWISKGDYMDDITAIVLFLDDGDDHSPDMAVAVEEVDLEAGVVSKKPTEEKGEAVDLETVALGFSARFWTLFAGFASGFLGGLCGIRGPPIIIYFLHPPYPVSFNKNTQRATGACITATNVAMRIAYYLVNTLAFDGEDFFTSDDLGLYVSIIICSVLGVFVGSKVFEYMKDSKATIRGILSIFLLLCGISLLLSFFANV